MTYTTEHAEMSEVLKLVYAWYGKYEKCRTHTLYIDIIIRYRGHLKYAIKTLMWLYLDL